MKKKQWTYHVTHSFKDSEGKQITGATQLYKTGVYLIVDNNSSLQFNVTPNDLEKQEKAWKKSLAKGFITDLEYGREITVIEDENGFFKEI